ncbi:hypothetical protein AAG906_013428 [Vitis piasezkii]
MKNRSTEMNTRNHMGVGVFSNVVRFRESGESAIQGMESIIATVSGYHGVERSNLIKLISQTGAKYVGTMSRSITHLVCWKFEGRKYSLAKKFKTLIVNHRWFEDCIKAGKRLPENSYLLQSGQEVGPLSLEVPLVSEKANPLTKKNGRAHSVRGSACDISKELWVDKGWGGADDAVWVDSFLLNEHEESSFRSHRHSVRQKRSNCNYIYSSTSSEPSRKGRRLVKKNASRDMLESLLSDSDKECNLITARNRRSNIGPPPNCSDGVRDESTSTIRRLTSDDGFYDHGSHRDGTLEDVEEIRDLNHSLASKDSKLHGEKLSTVPERTSQDEGFDIEDNINSEIKDGDRIRQMIPTSANLSCVICWTEFSSTRGVLPCGHRFCYSCIQSWADHMASRRKTATCPLCKASFVSITKVDDAAYSDQKIYSQTIPYAPSTSDILILADQESPSFGAQSSRLPVCCECRCREPEDLLVSCHLCRIRCVHSYCLDPPLLPWTCIHCKDLRMLYHHFH